MGQCYEHEQLGLDDAAIRCYRRALTNGDREGIAMHKLVRFYMKKHAGGRRRFCNTDFSVCGPVTACHRPGDVGGRCRAAAPARLTLWRAYFACLLTSRALLTARTLCSAA